MQKPYRRVQARAGLCSEAFRPFFWRGGVGEDRVPAPLCWLSTGLSILGVVRAGSRGISSSCAELDEALQLGRGKTFAYTPRFLNALRNNSVDLRRLIKLNGDDAPHQCASEGLRALFGMHTVLVPAPGGGGSSTSRQLIPCVAAISTVSRCMALGCGYGNVAVVHARDPCGSAHYSIHAD